MFTRQDLEQLVALDRSPVVSLFLPSHPAGGEVRQDPIRLRKLAGAACDQLVRGGLRRPDAQELLAPAFRLVDDEPFWRHQHKGLAVFVVPGTCRVYKVPVELAEQVVVGPHAHVTPLLPLLAEDGEFLLLALSASRARIWHGSRIALGELADIEVPPVLARLFQVPEERLVGAQPESDRHPPDLIDELARVIAAIEPRVKASGLPVVLAAQPRIQGHVRAAARWERLCAEGIADNPDGLRPAELHARAYGLMRARFAKARDRDLDRLNGLLGVADAKATLRVEEIVRAAREGRVDTLFMAEGEHLWGRFDPGSDRVVAHGSPVDGDRDLLDDAAFETLRCGGHVDLMPRQALPHRQPLAAILRY